MEIRVHYGTPLWCLKSPTDDYHAPASYLVGQAVEPPLRWWSLFRISAISGLVCRLPIWGVTRRLTLPYRSVGLFSTCIRQRLSACWVFSYLFKYLSRFPISRLKDIRAFCIQWQARAHSENFFFFFSQKRNMVLPIFLAVCFIPVHPSRRHFSCVICVHGTYIHKDKDKNKSKKKCTTRVYSHTYIQAISFHE